MLKQIISEGFLESDSAEKICITAVLCVRDFWALVCVCVNLQRQSDGSRSFALEGSGVTSSKGLFTTYDNYNKTSKKIITRY